MQLLLSGVIDISSLSNQFETGFERMVDEHDHETAPTAPYPGFFFPHHLNIDMLRMHIIGNVKHI